MKILLVFTFCLINAGTDAVTTVTGYRGRSVLIECFYDSGYEEYEKYLCRGECPYGSNKDIPVHSGSPAKDPRFSLHDDTRAKVFTVTITDLRPEDGGKYWCVIERTGYDIYTEIRLQVKTVDPAVSTVSHSTHPDSTQTHTVTPSVHAEITHSTTANPLSAVNQQTTTHKTPGMLSYAMISTGAGLFAVAVIIAIYCKIKRHGSETVTQSSREKNGDHEQDQNVLSLQSREKASLPKSVSKNPDPTTDQSDSIYRNTILPSNQSDSIYENTILPNNQPDSVYQNLTLTNNE